MGVFLFIRKPALHLADLPRYTDDEDSSQVLLAEAEGIVDRGDRLVEARHRAEVKFGPIDRGRIVALANHRNARERLVALSLMRRLIAECAPGVDELLPVARRLIADPSNICRWQALIVIAESRNPEEAWRVIRKFGSSEDSDMRAGVACVLLEHLLDEHFDEYFPKVRALMTRGSRRFADTLSQCWFDNCEGPHYRQVQKLLRKARRGRWQCK